MTTPIDVVANREDVHPVSLSAKRKAYIISPGVIRVFQDDYFESAGNCYSGVDLSEQDLLLLLEAVRNSAT